MNVKKLAMNAAALKAAAELVEWAGKSKTRRAPRKKGLAAVGKTVGGFTTTAGKAVGGLAETAGKTVEGVGETVGKTVSGVGEAVGKTVESTVDKTKDMTVGRVSEMKATRRQAKLMRRRQKIRQQRMDGIGMWIGFGLVTLLLYWWDRRGDKSVGRLASDAYGALRTAGEGATRAAQAIGNKAGEQGGRAVEEARARLGGGEDRSVRVQVASDRGPAVTGASGGSSQQGASTGGAADATAGESLGGRSEISGPGELFGSSGPAVSNGMKVVGFDGVDIGRVQEVEESTFILDRPKGADLRVPKDAVARVEGTVVFLRVAATRVVQQGWESVGNS